MDDRPKDPDIKALEAIFYSSSHRKSHSYSQQLRTITDGHHSRHQNHLRNHSLDEIDILDGGEVSDDEDFYRYPITTGSASGIADMMDYVGMGYRGNGFDESQLLGN